MEYKVYGHAGRPLLVFPTSNGRFFQYEDSGMIAELQGFIEAGKNPGLDRRRDRRRNVLQQGQ